MNHLAHLAIADALPYPGEGLVIGGFLGDYVKGRLIGRWPQDIEAGIQLHRHIDAFTDQHDIVREAQSQLPTGLRRYAGIITDILFDHLLARNWHDWYRESLPDFSSRALSTLNSQCDLMPEAARERAVQMLQYNALAGYGQDEFVTRSLRYLSTRLKRDNPLAASAAACLAQRPAVEDSFNRFYPLLIEFSEEWLNKR